MSSQAPVAQWIRRLPTEQEILGSIPGGGTCAYLVASQSLASYVVEVFRAGLLRLRLLFLPIQAVLSRAPISPGFPQRYDKSDI